MSNNKRLSWKDPLFILRDGPLGPSDPQSYRPHGEFSSVRDGPLGPYNRIIIRNLTGHLANFPPKTKDRTKSEEEFSLCRARLKKRLAYSRNGDNGKWKQGAGGPGVYFGGAGRRSEAFLCLLRTVAQWRFL